MRDLGINYALSQQPTEHFEILIYGIDSVIPPERIFACWDCRLQKLKVLKKDVFRIELEVYCAIYNLPPW